MTTETAQIDLTTALGVRREHLLRFQNPDGGWGYFPGKASWLEPTAYAALALRGEKHGDEAGRRALELLKRWQRPDGAWHANAQVKNGYWGTALMLTLLRATGIQNSSYTRGLEWLVPTTGAEGSLPVRIIERFQAKPVEQDDSVRGWPWRPGNSSWVEPTAHALVALKQSSRAAEFVGRIQEGEGYLLDRRCPDGGWNYGNKRVYHTDMVSFPETTALALVGLQGRSAEELKPSLDRALAHAKSTKSGMARAWLAIALRLYGVPWETRLTGLSPGRDISIAALEYLAFQPEAYQVFRVEKRHT